MHVALNDERWQVSDDASLMEVLADLSERASARQHLVTSLYVGDRVITDRELQPLYLCKPLSEVGSVRATSQPLTVVYSGVRATAQRLGRQLRNEGDQLLAEARAGQHDARRLDGWLGQMADFVEGTLVSAEDGDTAGQDVLPWIEELLCARSQRDLVRIADLLQYEILPRLPLPDASVGAR
ncbi:hypothetical protein YTPLAS18_27010 [Nitrospira sp.]|nr:hypothetical protein YTPLAS18_27010 [Nitrospira sp.]